MLKRILFIAFLCYRLESADYSLRHYDHVKAFYEEVSPIAIRVALDYDLPPAALLAIAGEESGYAQGYVAQITANILSLGCQKNDPCLPALYLPYSKRLKRVLFDPVEIKQAPPNDLVWQHRPKSRKKDYRPVPFAATAKQLHFFKYHPRRRRQAYERNFIDFSTRFITTRSRFEPFRRTRQWLDELVKRHSKTILLEASTSREFIQRIGGKKNSFNYRKSWPKKVRYVLEHAGLVALVRALYVEKKSFDAAWEMPR